MIQKGTPVPFPHDIFNLFKDVILFPMSPDAFTLDTNIMWQFMLLILLPVGLIRITKQLVKGVF